MTSIIKQIQNRKTFAIISHPDAGKTTLTEKLLLFGGAIQVAGAVKSNNIRKITTSDFAGIAGGTDVILIPEIPFRFEVVLAKVRQRVERGTNFSIIAVSEGAKPVDGAQVYSRVGDEIYVPRLGGIGNRIGDYLEQQGFETRVTVLGHLQRGGTPTPFDRWLATRFGAAAVRLAARGGFDRMVALQAGDIVDIPLEQAFSVPKRVDPNCDAVITARGMEISFGDR